MIHSIIFYFGTTLLMLVPLNVRSFGIINPISSPWARVDLFNTKTMIKRKYSFCSSALQAAGVQITAPSSEEAAEMGARDWPQQIKKGTWIEEIPQDEVKIRYVLDGKGTVDMSINNDSSASSRRSVVGPGTLVEATGPVQLEWTVKGNTGDDEMIILTPGYEQQGLLFAVAGIFLLLCGSLVIFS